MFVKVVGYINIKIPVISELFLFDLSGSGLADFFQEPKLGTTWYNPNGPTPTFDMKQTNQTVYEARLGSDAFMGCKVSLLNIITV